MESRKTARLLDIQEEKQFGDTVDWVIVRSQKLRLAAVTIWIQCCRKQGFFSLQFHSHGVQCSSTPQLSVLLILLSKPSLMISYSRKPFQAKLPYALPNPLHTISLFNDRVQKPDPALTSYLTMDTFLTSLRIKSLHLGLGMELKGLDVTIKGQKREPYDDGTVKYLDCGDGSMKLHM